MLPILPPHSPWHLHHFATLPSTMEALDWQQVRPEEVLLAWTDQQSAGRGQRGTHWESQAGQNLLFSFAFRPAGVQAKAQFLLSQITALALTDALRTWVEGLTIKWPNDIYYQQRKLSGMLLYHSLEGQRVAHTLVGIGLNVNQTTFLSDAPNPISLRQITGQIHSRSDLLQAFIQQFQHWVNAPATTIQAAYESRLYRRTGLHPYQDVLSGQTFRATLHTIAPDGLLTLRDEQGHLRHFAFKEVRFL